MVFRTSRSCCALVALGALGCSVDERAPSVATQPVLPQCTPETDAPRCVDAFVERCSAVATWQRDTSACEFGCERGACVDSGATPDGGGPQPSSCANDGDVCDDGSFCTVGDACSGGVCRGAARDCGDNVACTVGDACDEEQDRCLPGAAQCTGGGFCDAASGECVATCAGCLLSGVCHPDGAANPANACEVCEAATSTDAFTAADDTVACDDGIACTENDRCSGGGCAGTPVACAAGYSLELGASAIEITQGSSATVSLTLARDDDHTRPVTITVLGLPPGSSAAALELPPGAELATLTFSAEAQTQEGVSTTLTVQASDGFGVVSQPLELFVRGEPGSLDLSFGDGGAARAAPPGAPGFQGTRVVVDGEGRILVAATSRFVLDPLGVPARASLTRFAADGALDTGFASDGTYLETPGNPGLGEGPSTFLGDVALAPDGYVLAGPLGEGVVQEASFLTRLSAAGDRAAGFEAPALDGLRLLDVAVENGVILGAGDSSSNAAVYRSGLDGSGGQRFVESSILSALETVFWSPADNDFIIAGNCDPNACFVRVNAESDPPSFSPSPVTEVASASASISDGAADAQGRYFGIATGWNLVRFLPEAVRPPGAAPFSVVVDALAGSGSSPHGMEHAGDHLYVAAALPDPSGEAGVPAVIRYSTAWSRDARFATGGLAQVDGQVDVGSSVDVAVQSDGRVIVAAVDSGELVVYRLWD